MLMQSKLMQSDVDAKQVDAKQVDAKQAEAKQSCCKAIEVKQKFKRRRCNRHDLRIYKLMQVAKELKREVKQVEAKQIEKSSCEGNPSDRISSEGSRIK